MAVIRGSLRSSETALPGTVRPGRTAKVVFQGYFKADAVVVPSKVVHERMRGWKVGGGGLSARWGEEEGCVARVVQDGVLGREKRRSSFQA